MDCRPAPIEGDAFTAILHEVVKEHEAGRLGAPEAPLEEETVYYRLYNHVLIHKLEDKLLELEREMAERRRAEAALRESEARFRRLAENAQDLIYRVRLLPTRQFEYVSPAATAITGYTPEEHYADPDLGLKLVHPDDRPLLEAVARGEASLQQPLTLRWVRKDGQVIWTEQRNVPVFDETGQLIAIEGIARDITDRKQAEAQVAASAAELHALFAAMQDVVMIIDKDGVYREVAPTHPGLLAHPPQELIGKSLSDVFPPEQAPGLIDAVRKVLATGETQQIEYQLQIRERLVWFATAITPMGGGRDGVGGA